MNRRLPVLSPVCVLLVAVLAASLAAMSKPADATGDAPAQGRIGLVEDFSTAEGWWEWDADQNKIEPRVKLASKDGKLHVQLNRGLLGVKFKWPEEGVRRGSILRKNYGEVDLDKYHYLVVTIESKGSGVFFGINGFDTKCGYTTGTTVVDLKDYDDERIHGTRPVRLEMDLHDNSTELVVEEIKLVSELTAEEASHLIGRGLTIRDENLDPVKNHGLVELLRRAPGGVTDGQEMAVFRDTATGGVVTRLTSCGANDYVAEGPMWSADGAAFKFRTKGRKDLSGLPVYFLGDGRVVSSPPNHWAMWRPGKPAELAVVRREQGREFSVKVWNRDTGETREVATFTVPELGGYTEVKRFTDTGRLVVAFRETPHFYAIDLDKGEVEYHKLSTRLKDAGKSDKARRIHWARCYTYEGRWLDVDTGEEGIGRSYTVGHGCGGNNGSVGSFGPYLKILLDGSIKDPLRPGDDLKIWANWQNNVTTDYGTFTDDNAWIITNGTHGDVANQHVMVPSADTGAVLRLTRYFTKFSWESPTYSRPSPDYTKVVFCDNYGGSVPASLMMVQTRRPDAPTGVKLAGSKLTWDKPKRNAEIAGYHVYASDTSGRDFVRITDEPLSEREFEVQEPKRFYAVTAVEHSGLESGFTQELSAGGAKSFYFEAEEVELTPPARLFFDGRRNGFRVVRINAESPEEKARPGVMEIDVATLPPGKYALWALVQGKGELTDVLRRNTHGATGVLSNKLSGGSTDIHAETYKWVKLADAVDTDPKPEALSLNPSEVLRVDTKLSIMSRHDDLKIDTILLTAAGFEPKTADPRDATAPAAVKNLAATAIADEGHVDLTWDRSEAADVARYDVFVGADPDFVCDNGSVVRSIFKTELTDSGMARGKTLYYKVVAVDARGNRSEPAAVKVEGM
jgi:hypothetical protein